MSKAALLIRAGYTYESVTAAIAVNDWTLLKHSGFVNL